MPQTRRSFHAGAPFMPFIVRLLTWRSIVFNTHRLATNRRIPVL